MAFSAGGSGGVKSDINVTPLVDVVLVLLIIFLVTMPVLMRHITLEVPRELAADEVSASTSNPISLLGKADGTIIINDGVNKTSINRVALARTLRPMLAKKKTDKVVFVDFENSVSYDDAVSIMDTIRGAGAEKVALKIRKKKRAGQPAAPAQ